jgi:hypothetical protein
MPYLSRTASIAAMTSGSTAPFINANDASLNAPSMSNADESGALFHPEHAEARIVGHHFARPDRVDELGRERDADNPQIAPGGR